MELVKKVLNNDRASIAKAITLVESSNPKDKEESKQLISNLINHPGHSIRVGFSGPPGVGKSTFIESFGTYLVNKNYKLAILAIDPSSNLTGGSILGDKTRMSEISKSQNTFIRSTPSKGSLGGVSYGTREASIILDAAGYDFIFIETVGVGQSETMAANLVDIFTLIVGPGSGDELQGIKKGITEYADIFIVNKNDGDLKLQASKTASDYKSALSFYSKQDNQAAKEVLLVSSIEQQGMDSVIDTINEIINFNKLNKIFDVRRENQLSYWIKEEIRNQIQSKLDLEVGNDTELLDMTKAVIKGEISIYDVSDHFLDKFLK
jgi:LAO/AO transport system kinase